MNQHNPQLDELDQLLAAMVESTIDEAGVQRLEQLLRADPAARLKYHQHVSTHAALAWRYGAVQAEEEQSADAWGKVDSRILMEVIEEQARYNREREEAAAAERAKLMAARGEQADGRMRLQPDGGMNIARDLVIPRSLIFAAVAACLLLGALIWIELTGPGRFINSTTPGPLAVNPTPQDVLPVVAQVRSSVDARWGGLGPNQGLLRVDKRLTLAEGFADLELIDGARVVVEAPATFVVTGGNQMRLDTGKLVAYVPESAKGFVVATRGAKIVDLGTEFGVSATREGAVAAHVFEGEIVVAPAGNAAAAAPSSLTAGQALAVETDGSITSSDADDQAFVRPVEYAAIRDAEDLAAARWLAYTHKIRRDPALLAYYSFDESSLLSGSAANMAESTKGRFNATLGDGRAETAPAPATDRFGQENQALSFDRNNSQALYVNDWPQVGQLEALTISCWFRLSEGHSKSWALLVTQWNDDGTDEDGRYSFHLGLRNSSRATEPGSEGFGLQSHLSEDGLKGSSDPTWDLNNNPGAGPTSPADGWVHVVFTVECGGAVRMFRNGQEIDDNGAVYAPAHLPQINQPLAIGGKAIFRDGVLNPQSRGVFFSGEIDDVALFSRALSPKEVQRMYQSGKPADAGYAPATN